MTAAYAPPPKRDYLALAVFLAASLGAGLIGGLATASSVGTWYAGLAKPSFNPPNGVFGPVWTLLYILMAVAAWRVWRTRTRQDVRPALALYAAQLALNLAWSVIFFGLRQVAAALAEVVVLVALIVATTLAFWRRDRVAGALMMPYLAWVSFATALNFAIWRLNG